MNARIQKINKPLTGTVLLDGSKSISNRLLIIKALCKEEVNLQYLASADDTVVLQKALDEESSTYDVHHAGTSYRFLTSYLCLKDGEQILTGSSRMKERPIGPLVSALRELGASIEYLEAEGYPPLKVGKSEWKNLDKPLEIDSTISSQFISSLLLIAPALPHGLQIRLVGELVSRSYLEMTLKLMAEFGISYQWEEDVIRILPQEYTGDEYIVEADWSAASYYFTLVSLVPGSQVTLKGLKQDSIQGDSAIVEMMESLGVDAEWNGFAWDLKHNSDRTGNFEYNFLLQPDLAQSIAVCLAGHGINGLYTGLQTLKVKETDRIAALQAELQKVSVFLSGLPSKFSKKSSDEMFLQQGKAESDSIPSFSTYRDHRMAMSFACLAAVMDVDIEDPMVVSKSYPAFYEDLKSLGIAVDFS